jgi:hypothetical protein
MRQISKDISMSIDGSPQAFRLTKPDAFSGAEILRLLLRLQNRQDCHPERSEAELKDPTILDLITSSSFIFLL